jgi:uncharacterized repeat protein (TIGR01451 family)
MTVQRARGRLTLAVALATVLLAVATPASAKSLYMANHDGNMFDAWNINPDGTISYQGTYTLQHAYAPAGIAVYEEYDGGGNLVSATLFITGESYNGVELVDAMTLTSLGQAAATGNEKAGIAVDDLTKTVYTIERQTNRLYAYTYDTVARTLTAVPGFDPFLLPNTGGVTGIAFDEPARLLWLSDGGDAQIASKVRAFDVNTWTEDASKSFTPSHVPLGIAVDRIRRAVYTVSMDGYCAWVPPGTGSTIISRFDLVTRTETTHDMDHGGADVAVDENTGFVYVTGACSGDNISAWNPFTSPWTMLSDTGPLGSPAGLCIPAGAVAFNPLHLTKDDGMAEGACVNAGGRLNYAVCYDNLNDYNVTSATIVDTLPADVTFVSASGGGIYDAGARTVTWNLGTIPAGSAQQCLTLVVDIPCSFAAGASILNSATIDSEQTPATTQSLSTPVCSPPTPDCNQNGVLDACDIANGTSRDCNANGIPDSCDIAGGSASDCNSNSIPDSCDIASGQSADCNGNGIPDSCDIAGGNASDCNSNGIPDSCDIAGGNASDCNSNGIPDSCDIVAGTSQDTDGDGRPDECAVAPAPQPQPQPVPCQPHGCVLFLFQSLFGIPLCGPCFFFGLLTTLVGIAGMKYRWRRSWHRRQGPSGR